MEKDSEESDDPYEKNGIRKRIRDKFKTIAGETKAIKGGIMYLLLHHIFLSRYALYRS